MTTNIATTRDQSARLLQCGVDPETADMYYQTPITVSQKRQGEDMLLIKKSDATLFDTDTPAWSLSALLSLLPKKIMNGVSRIYTVEIAYSHTFNDAPWTINYEGNGLNKNAHFNGKSPIEACVKAIEWLTANNYKLNQP